MNITLTPLVKHRLIPVAAGIALAVVLVSVFWPSTSGASPSAKNRKVVVGTCATSNLFSGTGIANELDRYFVNVLNVGADPVSVRLRIIGGGGAVLAQFGKSDLAQGKSISIEASGDIAIARADVAILSEDPNAVANFDNLRIIFTVQTHWFTGENAASHEAMDSTTDHCPPVVLAAAN